MKMRSSVVLAIVVSVAAIAWVASGAFKSEAPAPEPQVTPESTPPKIPDVRVEARAATGIVEEVAVTGRTQASRMVEVKAETDGQIVKLLAEKGAVVKAGQEIAKLEIRDRAAKVEEAAQLVNQREIQYKAASELAEKGFNSRVRLAEARADLESARAMLKAMRVDIEKTTIRAPFDGVVSAQMIETGDYVAVGDPIMSVVDLDPVEIVGYVTESQVGGMDVGTGASADLLDGRGVAGTITYIASVADPETRTFPVEISIPNADHAIREGLTAKVTIPLLSRQGHKISPAILTLADDGTVGVKIVKEGNIVAFTPVTILKSESDFIWVGGLPDTARIITAGQEFVTDGQTVNPVVAEPATPQDIKTGEAVP